MPGIYRVYSIVTVREYGAAAQLVPVECAGIASAHYCARLIKSFSNLLTKRKLDHHATAGLGVWAPDEPRQPGMTNAFSNVSHSARQTVFESLSKEELAARCRRSSTLLVSGAHVHRSAGQDIGSRLQFASRQFVRTLNVSSARFGPDRIAVALVPRRSGLPARLQRGHSGEGEWKEGW